MNSFVIFLFSGLLPLSLLFSQPSQITLATTPEFTQVPIYEPDTSKITFPMEMGYGWPTFINPALAREWKGKRIHKVEMVFSLFPYNIHNWKEAYKELLQDRLAALYRLDSTLFTSTRIQWKYTMQMDCQNKEEAKALFHGFVIHIQKWGSDLSDVEAITFQTQQVEDSTAFGVLSRYNEWKNKLIVMDWTGSMYKYGGSVLLWHRLNMENKSVKRFVFFNDGNRTPDEEKKIGETGGIYQVQSDDIDVVLEKMQEVHQNGGGGDSEENDVEALLKGTGNFMDFDEVILIADNRSAVRDLSLTSQVKHPVKIVLCGVSESAPIHPDYLTLARNTKGSVHTIEEDIESLQEVIEGTTIDISGHSYQLKDGKFIRIDG